MCLCECSYLKSLEEGVSSPRAEVAGSCELPNTWELNSAPLQEQNTELPTTRLPPPTFHLTENGRTEYTEQENWELPTAVLLPQYFQGNSWPIAFSIPSVSSIKTSTPSVCEAFSGFGGFKNGVCR